MPKLKKSRADKQRDKRAQAREIGAPPKPTRYWLAKRRKCADSLREFCLTFLKTKFFLPFSGDHDIVIDRLEKCVRDGGLFAVAMPRGSGKSELTKAAALWGILCGYRRFIVIVGATAQDAVRIAADLRATLAHNDAINAAFPEATHAVRAMKGIPATARFQTIDGEPSGLQWGRDSIRLAFVPGAPCSGAVIRCAGLTGSIRGMSATGADGGSIRPDLVLLDDVQDRESASSPSQTATRERIVRGDVLGLAGPTKSIAAMMACTGIYENDLSDRFLDNEANPTWQGVRLKLVKSFPSNEPLWERYFTLRSDSLRAGGDGKTASEFYRLNRPEMDQGATISWPERFDPERFTSAIEEAQALRHDNPLAFQSEYQNSPAPEKGIGAVKELVAAEIVKRVNGVPRGEVPRECTRVTAMIDVGLRLLWWAVVGWDERFNGSIIDYGPYPRQNRPYFTAADARPALVDIFPGYSEPQVVHAGLSALTSELLTRTFPRHGTGEPIRIGKALVDCGWLPDTVRGFVRSSPHGAILLPSMGYATGSNTRPMDEWQVRPGERVGRGWRESPTTAGRGRQVLFDPDFWKSFIADRLLTPVGGSGAITLFGDSPDAHRLLADHLVAEYAVRVTARGREFDKWQVRPDRPENHLLDVVTGAAVAASVQGLVWSAASASGTPLTPPPRRPKVRLSDIYAAKHGGQRV